MEDPNPSTTSLVLTYGLVACPIFGIIAAITLILTDKLRDGLGRHIQPILILFYSILSVGIFFSLMSSTFVTVSFIASK
jgi:hypothetical protein